MQRKRSRFSAYRAVTLQLVLLTAISLKYGLISHPGWYKLLYVTVPLLVAVNLYPKWKGFRIPRLKRLKPFTVNP
ncbi:MAG TPA: hypothetical protein VGN63_06760 [Flavisolibacter sp.]|jgi:hypothetical protein|nr:hypothetical protein [Flavisolibacter sp.]